MTIQQIKWCAQHDWFISANYKTGEVLASMAFVNMSDRATGHQILVTNDFRKLVRWAGY